MKKRSFFKSLFCLIWMQSLLLDYLRAFLGRIAIIGSHVDLIIVLVFVVLIIGSLVETGRRIKARDIALYIFIVVVFAINLVNASNQSYLTQLSTTFIFKCAPLFLVGIVLNIDEIKKQTYWISIISIYSLIIYKFFLKTDYGLSTYWWQEDMVSAYNLLPHLLFVILFLFEKPSIVNVPTATIGCVLMFLFGSRGPVLSLFIFVFFYPLLFKKWKYPFKSRVIFLLSVACFLLLFNTAMQLLESLSIRLGMSVRLFVRLENGTILTPSGRDELQSIVIGAIRNNPIFGYGFAYDRVLLNGTYVHNIFLEILLSFGIIIGFVIFIFIICALFGGLLCSKTNFERGFVLLLICCGFVKLLLSGSYLDEPYFYLMLGYCLGTIRKNSKLRFGEQFGYSILHSVRF